MLESTQQVGREHDLWRAYAASRDPQARGELIEHYLPFAKIIAAKVFGLRSGSGTRFDDCLQYARVGLIEAIDRYDVSRGVAFEAYSSARIRGAILNGLACESELLAQRNFWRTRLRERTESLLGDGRARPEQASLEDLIQVTVGLALGMMLDDAAQEPADERPHANPYAVAELHQLSREVRRLLPQLPEREHYVIRAHYFELKEMQAIAAEYGISKGRVSQLHAHALARLRSLLGEQLDTKL